MGSYAIESDNLDFKTEYQSYYGTTYNSYLITIFKKMNFRFDLY